MPDFDALLSEAQTKTIRWLTWSERIADTLAMKCLWPVILFSLSAVGVLAGAANDEAPVVDSLERLRDSVTGRRLLENASKRFELKQNRLVSLFHWGKVSKTDAVLTRRLDPATGRESRQREVTIYLRKGQSVNDLVLDVSHELTHATAGPTWDPYDPELTPAKYIWVSIDGPGGEVDAIISECLVGRELKISAGLSSVRCSRYFSSIGDIDRERVRHDLYAVGRWKAEVIRSLGLEAERLTLLSGDDPQLYSSTGQAPYPVSLLREYEEITKIACENSRKRLEGGRTPAGIFRDSAAKFVARRCETGGTLVAPSSQ